MAAPMPVVDRALVVFNAMMLAHEWALKHWHFGPRPTSEQYIRAQLRFVLSAVPRPDVREVYRHLM